MSEEKQLPKARACWTIHLYLDCPNPNCEEFLDLADYDEFPDLHDDAYLFRTFNPGKSYTSEDQEIKYFEPLTCPKCGIEFELEAVEW